MSKIKKIYMKLLIITMTFCIGVTGLAGCSNNATNSGVTVPDKKIVKIGITTPDDIIWDAVKKKAAEDNIEIQTICFSNVNINEVLASRDVDLNAFQHYAYFEKNKADLGLDLVALGDMYILRLDIYSKKYKSLNDLPNGAKIAVPNDAVNIGRSLKVFEEAGLITLKDGAGNTPETADIASNPKNIQLVEIEHSQIVRSLDDVDAGIVFVKDAVDGGLDPSKDPIYVNNIDPTDKNLKQYINLIAARAEDRDNETYKKVVKAFNSEEVAQAIFEQFKHGAIPAWDEKYANQ
ncbi:NLPA lipoprotein [Clostridium sp. DL-VIII]|uniref:MetQ/NlpA family ABC transporter substrate-binding protein n=1 Tax=Clostridium sp. DL-VIII TaxID=641107 RepID=UPI00023B03A2|nr:MetQ/NlpA family ABC transporter substrate-binding protein [Clostridium sp. DL-VIII]EHJ01832.1 NLPA lipoprotein [Clostridium sp. DL-VIII]